MLRGNNGQFIFTDDEERYKLYLLLQEGIKKYEHRILAFCFMNNHIHLVIQLENVSLSKIIQNISFRYAQFYNWRHKTIGHLFQGRFKSILVDSDSYMRELIRYIHLNPVRAKLVANPIDYYWSSHRGYIMLNEHPWLSTKTVLMCFGESESKAITALNNFILAGINATEELCFEAGFSNKILDDDEFIKKINTKYNNKLSSNISFEILISVVKKKYEIDLNFLQKLGMDRKSTHIRAVIALIARDTEGVTLEKLAKFFGREASSLSKAAARLESKMQTSDALKEEIKLLINQCKNTKVS